MARFIERDRGYDALKKQMQEFKRAYILVGFQEGSKTKEENKDGRKKEGGLSMPEIAVANEYGTDTIPARPFLRPALYENRGVISRIAQREAVRILEGKVSFKTVLDRIGLFAVRAITQKIDSIREPPNSPRTIAKKRSDKPLIDFGQMRQAVDYKIVVVK